MGAGGEAEVTVGAAIEHELVGPLELARVAVGGRQPEPDDVALAHGAAVELDVLVDVAAVLDDQAVEAEELLDRLRDPLGVLDQQRPIVGMGGEVVEDVAEGAAGGVEAGGHQRQAERDHDVAGQRLAVDLGRQEVGDEVGLDVVGAGLALADGGVVVGLDLGEDGGHLVGVATEEAAEHPLDEGQQDVAVLDRQPEQGEEDLGREQHREVGGQVAPAAGDELVEQDLAAFAGQRLDALDLAGGEPRVEHVAVHPVLGPVEVLGQEPGLGVGIAERADDVVGEHVGPLQRVAHLLVPAEHPEALRDRVPDERRHLPDLVEALVVPEGGPGVAVVDRHGRADAVGSLRIGSSVCHGPTPTWLVDQIPDGKLS